MRRVWGVLALCVVVAGCSAAHDVLACAPAGGATAVQLTVKDSVTGLPAASGATVIALLDGAPSDSLELANTPATDAALISLGHQAGSYTIKVRKATYADWFKTGITVPSTDRCFSPATVAVVARLRKLP